MLVCQHHALTTILLMLCKWYRLMTRLATRLSTISHTVYHKVNLKTSSCLIVFDIGLCFGHYGFAGNYLSYGQDGFGQGENLFCLVKNRIKTYHLFKC